MARRANLRWGVEQRLEFIEFQLFWEGGVNRSDITSFFGVSVPQASKDLTQYQELAPKNLLYDRSEKRYLATSTFRPLYLKPDADRYLAELSLSADKTSDDTPSLLAAPPQVDTVPLPHRRVDPTVLRPILQAIREEKTVKVRYQSMNSKRVNPTWREITPHAFGSDGLRWHVRAFCHADSRFKDFLVSRCVEVRILDDGKILSQEDAEWHDFFEIILQPNPKLTKSQKVAVELDYDMSDGKSIVRVRRALLFYFLRRLRLDITETMNDPLEVPIVVANRAELNRAVG